MRVAGNKENITLKRDKYDISNPYKLPNQEFWRVSLKVEGNTKFKILFTEVDEANRFRVLKSPDIVLIKLPLVSEDNGKTIEEVYFHTKKVYEHFIKNMPSDDINLIADKARKVIDRQKLTLEDLSNLDYDDITEYEDSGLLEQIQNFEDDYTEKSAAAKLNARNILLAIADYYLDNDMLERNDYVKYKLVLEEHSLSTLVFQIDVSKKAIFELSKKIYLGTASTKDYDALSSIQKIVLEVNKYQSALIKEIIDDLQRVKVREIERNKGRTEDGTEDVDGVVINTSSRKHMMVEMKKIRRDSEAEIKEEDDDNK